MKQHPIKSRNVREGKYVGKVPHHVHDMLFDTKVKHIRYNDIVLYKKFSMHPCAIWACNTIAFRN